MPGFGPQVSMLSTCRKNIPQPMGVNFTLSSRSTRSELHGHGIPLPHSPPAFNGTETRGRHGHRLHIWSPHMPSINDRLHCNEPKDRITARTMTQNSSRHCLVKTSALRRSENLISSGLPTLSSSTRKSPVAAIVTWQWHRSFTMPESALSAIHSS